MRERCYKSFLGTCGCAALLLCLAHGQTQPSAATDSRHSSQQAQPTKPEATFHSESRLVVLDVVVTDHHGRLITGLSKSDFTLFENGKPQSVSIFEPHFAPSKQVLQTQPSPSPYQFSNFSSQSPSAINLVLFDVLNTPVMDQSFAREQMIQFLKTLPPGEPLALFELGTDLRMIAGFNTPSEDLIAAAKKLVPRHSAMLDSREERQRAEDDLADAREGMRNQQFFDRMHDFMIETQAARDENRAAATLGALAALARVVSGFRGRKNVLWLSEEFPVYFGPSLNSQEKNLDLRSFSDIMRDTAAKLSSAQMSIYPIDVRGLGVGGLAEPSRRGTPNLNEIQSVEDIHDAMDELAKETGGHAFYDTNDLKWAMRRSLENGSNYYTLAYVPQGRGWDSKYHQIKVRVRGPGLEAVYRKGYFATPEKPDSEADAFSTLLSAVQPATPQWTLLQVQARIEPPDTQHTKIRIHFHINGGDLTFTDALPDRKNDRLQLLMMAWDANLKPAGNTSHIVELSLPPDKYDYVMQHGIAASDELDLKPGKYLVCVGVMEEGSKKIGTLQMPFEIVQKKAMSTKEKAGN